MTERSTLGFVAFVAALVAGAVAWWMTREPSIDHTDRALLLSAASRAFAASVSMRSPFQVDVVKDRGALARVVEDGDIENVYRLQIMNLAEEPRRFALAVTGLKDIQIATEPIVEVPPAATQAVSVRVRVGPDAGKRGSNPIHFEVRALNHDDVFVREKASFLLP